MKKYLLLLLLVFFTVACGHTNEDTSAPMFNLADLDGNQVTMKEFAGEKVYVTFWASWCSICLSGLDELNTLAAKETDFKVISIVSPTYKSEQSSDKFTKWFTSLGMDHLPVLLDEDGIWSKNFGVLTYPTSYYIGTDGTLVQTIIGPNSNEAIINTFNDIH